MIVEVAELSVTAGLEEAFVETLFDASGVLSRATGYQFMEVARGIDRPSVFLFRIGWETVKDHLEFRETDDYETWREFIGPFLDGASRFEHFEPISIDK
jgi:heme-degrading monooxygenase HmoA